MLPTPQSGGPIGPPTETPALTATELAQLRAVARRLEAMHHAAQQLNDPQVVSGADWRGKMRAQAIILLGAKGAIDNIGMPERYRTPRLIGTLDGCMVVAERLSSPDIQRSEIIRIDGLERCVNGLSELVFVYTEYTN
jgi:hypothetical protein